MRPFELIMGNVLRDQIVHVLLAKDQEVVQAFLANTLHPPFDEGIFIRRPMGRFVDVGPAVFDDLVKTVLELAVPITHDDLRL